MCGRLCALPGRCRVAPRQESAACAPGRLVAAGTGACARAARRIEALALPWQPSGLQARLQPASLQRACLEQCAGGVTWQMLCCGAVRALSWAWGCCEDTARGEQQVPVGRGVHGCLCRDTWAGSGEGALGRWERGGAATAVRMWLPPGAHPQTQSVTSVGSNPFTLSRSRAHHCRYHAALRSALASLQRAARPCGSPAAAIARPSTLPLARSCSLHPLGPANPWPRPASPHAGTAPVTC